jgi:methionyl-tRNA formyltransferase
MRPRIGRREKSLKVIFMGTPEFSVPSLEMLIKEEYEVLAVVTQPDRPKGRGKKLNCPPVKEYAIKEKVCVLQPKTVKDPQFISLIREKSPDIIITVAYGKILPKDILNIPKKGCINVHASLLPKYRGAAPINWAIINGEKMTGISTMLMDTGMDTGDILLKKEKTIPEDITAGDLYCELALLGAEVLKKTLEEIQKGVIQRIPQDESEATYAPLMKKDMGFIQWEKSAKSIHNLIRGTNPWPGAFTLYKEKRIKIWKSEIISNIPETNRRVNKEFLPGTIIHREKEGILVACGKGYIRITELQFDGCKRLCVDACWHNFDIGSKFQSGYLQGGD